MMWGSVKIYRDMQVQDVKKVRVPFRRPHNKDYSILGHISGGRRFSGNCHMSNIYGGGGNRGRCICRMLGVSRHPGPQLLLHEVSLGFRL